MFITVFGSSGCSYDRGNDTASFLINNSVIIDAGWNLVENILDLDLNPSDFKTILFTHFHQDHYLALPQFLFYFINSGKRLSELTLIGPGDLGRVVRLAADFLQLSRFFDDIGYPECIEIAPGESFSVGDLFVETHKSVHPVDGRYYKITDKISNKTAGFSGDTAYSEDESAFFSGCDLLVHECSLGGSYTGDNFYLHSSAEDAAAAANGAGVKKLALAHYREKQRAECIAAAKNKFDGDILTPLKGDIIYV